MNRDAMLVALGVGVGALISTEQGRHIIGSLAKTPVAQALGEGTINLFKAPDKQTTQDKHEEPTQQHVPESELPSPGGEEEV